MKSWAYTKIWDCSKTFLIRKVCLDYTVCVYLLNRLLWVALIYSPSHLKQNKDFQYLGWLHPLRLKWGGVVILWAGLPFWTGRWITGAMEEGRDPWGRGQSGNRDGLWKDQQRRKWEQKWKDTVRGKAKRETQSYGSSNQHLPKLSTLKKQREALEMLAPTCYPRPAWDTRWPRWESGTCTTRTPEMSSHVETVNQRKKPKISACGSMGIISGTLWHL